MTSESRYSNWQEKKQFKVPESLTQTVYHYLQNEIIEGRLEEGKHLVPQELGRQLGVSKSPVREALCLLEMEELVKSKPRTGFFVADIHFEDIEEIYPIRAALNSLLMKTIIENGYSTDFIPYLQEIVMNMDKAVTEKNIEAYFHHNVQFYRYILSCCTNTRLKMMVKQLGNKVLRFRFLSMSQPGQAQKSLQQHHLLLKALQNRDVEGTRQVCEQIIERALGVLREYLSRGKT